MRGSMLINTGYGNEAATKWVSVRMRGSMLINLRIGMDPTSVSFQSACAEAC